MSIADDYYFQLVYLFILFFLFICEMLFELFGKLASSMSSNRLLMYIVQYILASHCIVKRTVNVIYFVHK